MPIHPTAVIDSKAEIAASADIGPYAVIVGPVRIGERARVYWHASVTGWTEIGDDCRIHPYAIVGHLPQDVAYANAESYCRVGEGTMIREGASIHRGTAPGSTTVVGRHCFIMANTHIGHNCNIGDNVTIVNSALLAGHVTVGNSAVLSGMSGFHQFVRIGELAMIGGQSRVRMDIPPFFTAVVSGKCAGVNVIGMRRAGYSAEERDEIREAFRILYRSGLTFTAAVERLAEVITTAPGKRLLEFLQAPSKRGIAGARSTKRRSSSNE